MIYKIIAGTPYWVWFLFAFLLYRGIKAFKPSEISITRMAIVPFLLTILSVQSLFTTYWPMPYPSFIWMVSFTLGLFAGWFLVSKEPIVIDRNNGLIQVTGNKLTLIFILIMFAVRWYAGYTSAVNPAFAYSLQFFAIRFIPAGLISGIAMGRLINYAYKYVQVER